LRIALSVLLAGLSFAVWLALFLVTKDVDSVVLRGVLWFLSPVFTAFGFACGAVLANRITSGRGYPFRRVFLLAVFACAVGAVSVFWIGPMLIVFAMFFAGTASVAALECWVLFQNPEAI
jgi:hypothetical protein